MSQKDTKWSHKRHTNVPQILFKSTMKNLASRVKKLREKKGLSQSTLANMLDISYMNIANIETGRVKNPRYLSKLAEVLETTTSFLLDGITSNTVQVEKQINIVSLTEAIDQDPSKDYWVIEIDKKEKLFLTDSAIKVSKVKKVFK
jgi:transcriptional regulator with XRE-family HTH domain